MENILTQTHRRTFNVALLISLGLFCLLSLQAFHSILYTNVTYTPDGGAFMHITQQVIDWLNGSIAFHDITCGDKTMLTMFPVGVIAWLLALPNPVAFSMIYWALYVIPLFPICYTISKKLGYSSPATYFIPCIALLTPYFNTLAINFFTDPPAIMLALLSISLLLNVKKSISQAKQKQALLWLSAAIFALTYGIILRMSMFLAIAPMIFYLFTVMPVPERIDLKTQGKLLLQSFILFIVFFVILCIAFRAFGNLKAMVNLIRFHDQTIWKYGNGGALFGQKSIFMAKFSLFKQTVQDFFLPCLIMTLPFIAIKAPDRGRHLLYLLFGIGMTFGLAFLTEPNSRYFLPLLFVALSTALFAKPLPRWRQYVFFALLGYFFLTQVTQLNKVVTGRYEAYTAGQKTAATVLASIQADTNGKPTKLASLFYPTNFDDRTRQFYNIPVSSYCYLGNCNIEYILRNEGLYYTMDARSGEMPWRQYRNTISVLDGVYPGAYSVDEIYQRFAAPLVEFLYQADYIIAPIKSFPQANYTQNRPEGLILQRLLADKQHLSQLGLKAMPAAQHEAQIKFFNLYKVTDKSLWHKQIQAVTCHSKYASLLKECQQAKHKDIT